MARAKQKTIITCAVTGAIHTPTMSDALPYTYDDIARQAIDAAEAGASILHLHARDNETGAPSVNPDDFAPFLPRIKQATDAVVNISTGGSLTLSIQDRIKPAATFSAEMCSMNMGSMNFSFHPLAKRYGDDATFVSAGSEPADAVDPAMISFLDDRGIALGDEPPRDLATLVLALLCAMRPIRADRTFVAVSGLITV